MLGSSIAIPQPLNPLHCQQFQAEFSYNIMFNGNGDEGEMMHVLLPQQT